MKINVKHIPSEHNIQVNVDDVCNHWSRYGDTRSTDYFDGQNFIDKAVEVEVCDFCSSWRPVGQLAWEEK